MGRGPQGVREGVKWGVKRGLGGSSRSGLEVKWRGGPYQGSGVAWSSGEAPGRPKWSLKWGLKWVVV